MSKPKPTRAEYLDLVHKMKATGGTFYFDVMENKNAPGKRRYIKVKNLLPLDAQVLYVKACKIFNAEHIRLYKAHVPYWMSKERQLAEPDTLSVTLTSYWNLIKE